MLTECNPEPMQFARLDCRDVVADFDGGAISSVAGAFRLATAQGKLEARRARCAPLAGKSTLNRLEYTPSEYAQAIGGRRLKPIMRLGSHKARPMSWGCRQTFATTGRRVSLLSQQSSLGTPMLQRQTRRNWL